jgi:hypothetical protein
MEVIICWDLDALWLEESSSAVKLREFGLEGEETADSENFLSRNGVLDNLEEGLEIVDTIDEKDSRLESAGCEVQFC